MQMCEIVNALRGESRVFLSTRVTIFALAFVYSMHSSDGASTMLRAGFDIVNQAQVRHAPPPADSQAGELDPVEEQRKIGLQRAIGLFNEQKFLAARRSFEAMLVTELKKGMAEYYLGRIALEEGDFDESVQHLERAVSIRSDHAEFFLWLARARGMQAQKAGVPGGIGPALKSKSAFEKAIALDPNLVEAREDLVQFHREAPGIIGGSRRVARLQAAEIKKRDTYIGTLVQGDLLLDEKKFREAERIYRSAVDMKPDHTEAYYRLGLLYLETKEIEKAFTAFDKILELKPSQITAEYYIGQTGATSGQRLSRAEAALKHYLATKPWSFMPSLSDAHFRLGQIYQQKNEASFARKEFEAALNLEPDHKEAKTALKRLDR